MANKKLIAFILSFILIITNVNADCTDDKGNPIETTEDGVGGFFHNLGCSIQRGAKKVGEGAMKLGEKETWQKIGEGIEENARKIGDADTWKNLGDDISDGAKRFGQGVKEKFSDIKDKISGTSSSEEVLNKNQNNNNKLPINNNYTFELPLLIDIRSMNYIANNNNNNNEKINDNNNHNIIDDNKNSSSIGNGKPSEQSPQSLEDRFLTNTPKRCPDGQELDERNTCRKITKFTKKK